MKNKTKNLNQYINGNEPITRGILRGLIDNKINVSDVNTINIKDMSYLFSNTNFNQDISGWNTENVTNMEGMFNGAKSFNQSVNNFDTRKVTNMRNMFWSALNFNQGVNSFDTSNVTDMWGMFGYAYSFNQSLKNFNTSQVRNMGSMFLDADSLITDLSNWNVDKVEYFLKFTDNRNITLPKFKKVA